ncbi:MAG: DUF3107 domain-containing protein [Cellulomonadaceae bacterium]|jgi:hypothetical protein|nr:DUF3107 domain-containing protein [Cellulomonadaceae bacterium]
MEISIGVNNTAREITIDAVQSTDEVKAALAAAIENQGVLELTDARGRIVLVPAVKIGYVEIGPEETRRVGFGSA